MINVSGVNVALLLPLAVIATLVLIAHFDGRSSTEPFDSRLYLAGPTKCFSCERDMVRRMGPEWAWMGKQSKCFDCERQLARVHPDLANFTHGTKCFGCEAQLAPLNAGAASGASIL